MSSELAAQIPSWEQEAEQLEIKAQALRQMVSAVKALNGDADALLIRRSFESHRTTFEIAPFGSDGPRGPRAVLIVMAEDPDREWKVVEVKREMLRRGWAPSPKAVEASIKRLREIGQVTSTSYGYYMLAPAGRDEIAAPTDVQREDGDER